MIAARIHADGNVSPIEFTNDTCLAEFKQAVGGWVELVPCILASCTLFCNEEGKLLGLPPNPLATALAEIGHDWIAGDAVLAGPTGQDGYTTGLVEALDEIDQHLDRVGHVIDAVNGLEREEL